MNDAVAALRPRGQKRGVSRRSPRDDLEVADAQWQAVVAEQHQVVDDDLVAGVEQLGHEHAPDVARTSGHKNFSQRDLREIRNSCR